MMAGAFALLAPLTSHAQNLRFKTTQPGGIVAVGNTLGLAKAASENGPGTSSSIGTFIALDATSVDDTPLVSANPWGPLTTNNWTKNGSTAKLVLPGPEAEVLYAELVWGGSYKYGGEDVSMFLDFPVRLACGANAIQPKPEASTKSTLDYIPTGLNTDALYYSRSADVTEFVSQNRSCLYEVSGVPGTESTGINALNAAGWALVIAYRHDDAPLRDLSILVGNGDTMVDANATVDYSASDFCAPPSGAVTGSFSIAALGGDANHSGDTLGIAADAQGSFVSMSGPNNPANNFFASQINDAKGLLDLAGSFGTRNHDAASGTNVAGARQGWDVTTVALSSAKGQLAAGQRTAVVRAATTSDSFLPLAGGLAVDVAGPRFSFGTSATTVSPAFANPGQRVTITTSLANEGIAIASDVRFSLELPKSTTLESFAIDGVAGNASHEAILDGDLRRGVAVGAVAGGATRTVTLVIELDGSDPSASMTLSLQPLWSYHYVSCADVAPLAETFRPKALSLAVRPGTAADGDAGAGAAPPHPSPDPSGAEDGSCAMGPTRASTSTTALAVLGVLVAGLAARRRRRQS
jgi:uncharacterized repeat protein (TIGR01451 family)/MYXO-CTERM domain-containing protein